MYDFNVYVKFAYKRHGNVYPAHGVKIDNYCIFK